MSAGEVNGQVWTIPATRAKNGRARIVPLPLQAVDLLRGASTLKPDALVFPSKGGGVLSNWDRETKRLHRLSGTSGWHRHDLRRAVATLLGDLGFAPHVVSVVLGHAHIAEGATAVYARSRYQREHREALQALADEIDRVVTDRGNVVRLAAVPSMSGSLKDLFHRFKTPPTRTHDEVQRRAKEAGWTPPWDHEERQKEQQHQKKAAGKKSALVRGGRAELRRLMIQAAYAHLNPTHITSTVRERLD